MSTRSLSELLGQLASRVAPDRSIDEMQAGIDEVLDDNGLGRDAPAWLCDLVAALLDQRRVERTPFPRVEMDNDRWDVTNALAELGMLIPLGFDDYGEAIAFNLEDALKMQALISREGRDGAYAYEVSPRHGRASTT